MNTTTTASNSNPSPFKSPLAALKARLSSSSKNNNTTRSERDQEELEKKRQDSIKPFAEIELSPAADFHVHLRDGELMELVTPTIEKGGVGLVYVMVCFSLSSFSSSMPRRYTFFADHLSWIQ